MTLPTLKQEDVREALKEMYGAGRQHHLFAFYGTGGHDSVRTDFAGTITIMPVGSELELRRHLPPLNETDAKIAFLVPWRGEVPMDLRGRFARNGVIRVIGKDLRIRRLFEVEQVADDVATSPLFEFLLSATAPVKLTSRKSILTRDEMWRAWLAHEWGTPFDDDYALDSLLAWAASDARGPAWSAKLMAAGGQSVLQALREHLVQKRGEAAGVVLAAWLQGRGGLPLELGLVCQPALPLAHLGLWIRQRLRSTFELTDEALMMQVAAQLAAAVPTALRELSRHSESVARALLERADKIVDDSEVAAELIESSFLPSAWRMRLDAYGAALLEAAKQPDAPHFRAALAAQSRLEKHESFKQDSVHSTVVRADMALRLLAWLASDARDLEPLPAEPDYAQVERLGRWYVEEGGFVDWARRLARGTSVSVFDRGVQAIVTLADERRQQLDRRFAAAIPRWLQAKRPSTQVIPIEDVGKRVIGRFLDGKADRSLLVLLLDGMAWAQAIELLLSLKDEPEQWGPLAWHTSKHGLGDAAYPVVAAALPTVTEISRSAFFAGKLMTPGRDHATDKDSERWKDNTEVSKYAAPGDWPRLLLRGLGHEAHGVASNEALSLISDRGRRVVGLVINAIDSALKGDSQQWHPWTIDHVRSLRDILAAARDAGRSVLLASDHGHVPCDRMDRSVGALTDGARWRALRSTDEPVEPCEVKLFGPGVWTPKGASALALIADDGHRYGGGAHAGEHGGASLAEVIAPCVLIRWEDPIAAQHDRDLTVGALMTPPWWYRELQAAPVAVAAPRPKRSTPAAATSSQLGLPEVVPTVTTTPTPIPPRAAVEAPRISPAVLVLSEVPMIQELARERRERLLRALAFLLERGDIAKLDAFAGHMGLPTFRARGFVADQLSPVLNVDGYQVVSCDETHVRLDREKLAQQLEIVL